MQENQIQTILGFYDQSREFQKNDRYSDHYQSVYTKPYDNSHWLVAIPHGKNRLEIHQTDEHGIIIARDIYESRDNKILCLSIGRLQKDRRRMVEFFDDEINLIYRSDKNEMLKEQLPENTYSDTDRIERWTMDKLSSLSPEVRSMLISYVNCREIYERRQSLKERLAQAEIKVNQSITNEKKNGRRSQVKGREPIR